MDNIFDEINKKSELIYENEIVNENFPIDKNIKLSIHDMYKVKETFKKLIAKDVEQVNLDDIDEDDTISLFHGTSTYYINPIRQVGILSRKHTEISNWEHHPSVEGFTYLTNKWHYFYAMNAVMELQKKGIHSFPCYIECKVPKKLLVPDEDFVVSNYVKNKLNRCIKKDELFELSWEESLNQYATVGVIGNIPPKYIVSFTVISDPKFLSENLVNERSQYMKDFKLWQQGKGKGELRLRDLLTMESTSNKNGTWWIKDLPKNSVISQIYYNEARDKISVESSPIGEMGLSDKIREQGVLNSFNKIIGIQDMKK